MRYLLIPAASGTPVLIGAPPRQTWQMASASASAASAGRGGSELRCRLVTVAVTCSFLPPRLAGAGVGGGWGQPVVKPGVDGEERGGEVVAAEVRITPTRTRLSARPGA